MPIRVLVLAALTSSLFLSTSVDARTHFILNLDAWTWDKVVPVPVGIQVNRTQAAPSETIPSQRQPQSGMIYIIRFDKEFPHGKAHDAFGVFAQHIANASAFLPDGTMDVVGASTRALPILLGEVRLKDMGESKNIPILRRFGLSGNEAEIPQIAMVFPPSPLPADRKPYDIPFLDVANEVAQDPVFDIEGAQDMLYVEASGRMPFVNGALGNLRYPLRWFMDSERNRTTDALCRWVILRTGYWLPTLRGTSPAWREWAHRLFRAASQGKPTAGDTTDETWKPQLTRLMDDVATQPVEEPASAYLPPVADPNSTLPPLPPKPKAAKSSYLRLASRLIAWVTTPRQTDDAALSAAPSVQEWYRHEQGILSDLFYHAPWLSESRRALVDREWNVLLSFAL